MLLSLITHNISNATKGSDYIETCSPLTPTSLQYRRQIEQLFADHLVAADTPPEPLDDNYSHSIVSASDISSETPGTPKDYYCDTEQIGDMSVRPHHEIEEDHHQLVFPSAGYQNNYSFVAPLPMTQQRRDALPPPPDLPIEGPPAQSHIPSIPDSPHTSSRSVSPPPSSHKGRRSSSLKSSNGDKKFICTFPGCGRAFSRNFNLSTHYNTHLGVKPFACDQCDKSFSRRHDLGRHVTAVHSGKEKKARSAKSKSPGGSSAAQSPASAPPMSLSSSADQFAMSPVAPFIAPPSIPSIPSVPTVEASYYLPQIQQHHAHHHQCECGRPVTHQQQLPQQAQPFWYPHEVDEQKPIIPQYAQNMNLGGYMYSQSWNAGPSYPPQGG